MTELDISPGPWGLNKGRDGYTIRFQDVKVMDRRSYPDGSRRVQLPNNEWLVLPPEVVRVMVYGKVMNERF